MSEKQASGMAAATPILISTRRVRLPGTCFLAPDTCNGVAVRASLLPRYQESGIRDQKWCLTCSASGFPRTPGTAGICFLIPAS